MVDNVKCYSSEIIKERVMKKRLLLLSSILLTACSSDPGEDFNKAVEHADNQNWVKSAKYAKRAAENNPTSLTEAFNALCLLKQSKQAEAIEVLERLAQKESDSAVLQYICGKALLDSQNLSAAYYYLNNSYKLDKSNHDCLLLLFQTAVKLNKPEAKTLFLQAQKIPKLGSSAVLTNNIAVWYAKQGLPNAYQKFRVASLTDRDNPQIMLNNAILLDQKKHYASALKGYRTYLLLTRKQSSNQHLYVSNRIAAIENYLKNQSP